MYELPTVNVAHGVSLRLFEFKIALDFCPNFGWGSRERLAFPAHHLVFFAFLGSFPLLIHGCLYFQLFL